MLAKIFIYMILFFLVANPATFKIMRKALGSWVASAEGLPSSAGLMLHSVVYVFLACYLPAKLVSGYGEEYEDEKYDEEGYEDDKYEEGYEDDKYEEGYEDDKYEEGEGYEAGVYTSHAKAAPQFRPNVAPGLPQTTMGLGGIADPAMSI